jgi:hypothetical protein
MEKDGVPTVTEIGMVAVIAPLTPETVAVYWPAGTVLAAVSVRVVPPLEDDGEKEAATPLGNPETEKMTVPSKPKEGFTQKLVVVEVPWPSVKLL